MGQPRGITDVVNELEEWNSILIQLNRVNVVFLAGLQLDSSGVSPSSFWNRSTMWSPLVRLPLPARLWIHAATTPASWRNQGGESRLVEVVAWLPDDPRLFNQQRCLPLGKGSLLLRSRGAHSIMGAWRSSNSGT